jgi:tRNA(Ser,Leu) C12 N-acetylase TAN1
MSIYSKYIVLVILIFLNSFSHAQEKKTSQQIKWTQPKAIKISQYDTQKLLSFEGAQYIGEIKELPYIQKVVPIQSNMEVALVEIENSIYTSLNSSELSRSFSIRSTTASVR